MFNQLQMINMLYNECDDNIFMEGEEVKGAEHTLGCALREHDKTAFDVGGIMENEVMGYGLACEKAGFFWGVKCTLALVGRVGE